MPTGPGDEILKAIGAGKSDDAIIKQYSIDPEQLKAFKSLQYGLSNKKVDSNEINDYYPELKKYFTGPPAPAAPKQQEATDIERPDFTKPVKQPQPKESTAAPASLKAFQQEAESGKAGETLQQKFEKKYTESVSKINSELENSDDVIRKMIRQGRYEQAEQQGYNQYAEKPRSDMPATAMLANLKNNIEKPETETQFQPVNPEEVMAKRDEIFSDQRQVRNLVNQMVVHHPEKAKDIQESMYMTDAMARMKDKPDIGLKVNENLKELQKGELKYNAVTGQLTREEGFLPSLLTGVRERTKQLNDYDLFQMPDDKLIALMEQRRKDFDPDKPVSVPTGAGEIGQMLGMEWSNLLKGAAVNTATTVAAGVTGGLSRVAAPYITAAVTAPEFYKRGYSSAFDQSYNEARSQNKSPEEALKLARAQAKTEGNYGAAEGAVMSIVGSRIGMRELPKFKITDTFKNTITTLLNNSKQFIGHTTVEGLANGLISGEMQEQKDIAAREKGFFRDSEKNIKEKVIGSLVFSFAMGAMTKIGKPLLDPETYSKIKYYLGKQDPEAVNEHLGSMVMGGEITQEDADNIHKEIDEQHKVDQTVPEDIKDVSRMAMLDKIAQRQELEKQLETTDEYAHPKIKEQIKELNKQILEHSEHLKSNNESETEAKTQSEAEGIGNAVEPQQTEQTQPVAGDEKVEGEPAPVSEISTQDQTTENAIPEQSPEGVHVPASPSNSEALGQGNESQGTVNEGTTGTQKITPEIQEQYNNSPGMQPNDATGRVMPAPIEGSTAKPKKKWEIIRDVARGLKQRIIYAKGRTAGVLGSYYSGFKGIKISYNGDLDTSAHEIGHAIDDHFDLYSKMAADPEILQELDQFSSHGSTPPSNHPNPRKYIDQEGFAEWMRAYIVNPDVAEQMAPKLTELYKSSTSEEFQKVIKQFSDDYRVWRFSEGRDQLLSNVRTEYEENKGLLGKLFKKEETDSNFIINWVDRLAANFINPLHAFEKAFKYAQGLRGIDEVLPANDPIILSRILNGIDGKYGEILKNGMIDGENNVLKDAEGNPKNLKWLLAPLDNTDMASIKKDMDDTIAFMLAKRTIELAKRFNNKNKQLVGVGEWGITDLETAHKALNEFEAGDPKRLARIEEAANRYKEFANDILRYAVDKGRMSEEQYNEIKENNDEYVALHRYLQTEPDEEIIAYPRSGGKELGSKAEITHKVKGSTKAIENPYASILDILYKAVREADRNEVMQAFRNMLVDPKQENPGNPKRLADIGIIGVKGDKEAIPIFMKGKPEYWIFQKDIYRQLKAFDLDPYRVPGILRMPGQVLRFATVHFPTFAGRNWLRDLQDRMIKSTTGSGIKELWGNKEDWNAIARAGGLNSGYYLKSKDHYYGLMTEAMDGMAKNKNILVVDPVRLKHVWHKYEDLLYKGETSNRVAEYRSAMKKAKDQGMDDYNAMIFASFKARDLVDFAVAGHWMRVINQIIPFSNAAVQGLRSGYVSAKTKFFGWNGFAARMLAYSVIPGVAAWYYNNRTKEDKDRYKEIPPYQRDMFWNFRIGPNKWMSLPKPYELALPQAGIDRALSYIYADDKKAFDGYGADVRKLLLPVDEGNLTGPFQPIIESMVNYDFFRDHTVIPTKENTLDLSMRHTETASRLGQLLQNISNWDGRKWDYFIKRQFSYTGNFVLKLSDIGKENSRQAFDLSDTGLFKRSPAYNSRSVQEMLKYAEAFDLTHTQGYKGFNALVGEYFTADNDKDREEKGKQLYDFAAELLAAWKADNAAEKQKAKAAAKKAAQKEKK